MGQWFCVIIVVWKAGDEQSPRFFMYTGAAVSGPGYGLCDQGCSVEMAVGVDVAKLEAKERRGRAGYLLGGGAGGKRT